MYKLIVTLVFLIVLAASGKADDTAEFVLKDDATNTTCALLNATMQIVLGNNKTNATWMYQTLNVTDVRVNFDDSTCNNATNDKYNRTVMVISNETFSIEFEFIGVKDEQWNISKITVDFINESLTGYVDTELFGSFDYQRSYMCNSFYNLTHVNTNNRDYTMYIGLSNVRVQAFEFDKKDSESFGDTARCAQDIKGSKIVPIAVGAALAGLVIIVLIAYIIGRLRSRKQSSYEALS